ncbi:hypothetical protein FJ661_08085 [Pseudarthrobacter phenanthrenivorans]|uniref:DUF5666 domain-containing protein n=1 Tax=Pseudarthrobacter phenanthrenivorans TaxID=361575 RepID=UPI00112DDB6A|nr:DUF5666 domain-containing protein [Pseudarthrobacter phenanthrenivorans]TPV51447.1 hypothetical protein FJ661_08085 [Pseudarthrobacter phenanthrenivorans]
MSVRDPLKIRKTLLAAAVAVALTGTGVAFAWGAGDPPAPAPSSSSTPGQDNTKVRKDKSQRPQQLHGESVVKKADGSYETELSQRGTVEAASSSSITVKSEDGFSQTYAIDAGTKARPSLADIAPGDTVRISGVKNGGQATAERIVEGAGDRPGLRLGRGNGHGNGQGHGKAPK